LTQEKKTEAKINRRSYLKYVGGAVVAAGVAAAGYYYYTTLPPPTPTPTPTTVAPPPTTTVAPPPTTTTVAPTPITVVLGDVDELGRLDPHIGSWSQEARLYPNMYDTLVEYNTSVPPKPVPQLAESWDVSPDGKEYTFHLVKGAKFHDGTEITADDVVFSMNRCVTLNQGFSFLWQPVMASPPATAVDNYTVKMVLKAPFAPFVSTMAYFFIMNKKVMLDHIKKPGPYGDMGDYGSDWLLTGRDSGTLSGSGPMRWIERIPGTQDRFERFNEYWRGWKIEGNLRPFDIWIHRKVPEEATLKTLMRTGEVQMIFTPYRSTEFYLDLSTEPTLSLYKMVGAVAINMLMFNCAKPPLDDVHVRRALSYCFDYDSYIKDIRKGIDIPMNSPLGKSYGMHNDDIVPYTLDLKKAEEELSLSKYSKADIGKRSLEFSWTSPIEERRLAGLVLKTNAEKLGFKIDIVQAEYMQQAGRIAKKDTCPDILTNGGLGFYPDPDSFLYPMYHTSDFHTSFVNPDYYVNPDLDKLLEDGRATTDSGKRLEIYRKVQQMIYQDAPAIWTSEVPSMCIMDKRIKGFVYNWEFETYRIWPLRWEVS
jgi:peptide/nickel transport system substrate-binding protein